MGANIVFEAPIQKTCKRLKPTSNFTLAATYPTLSALLVTDPSAATDYPVVSVNANGNGLIPNWLNIIPYGRGAENDTIVMWFVGFTHILTDANASAVEWVPVPLAEVTCTLSTFVGVSGSTITDSDRFADTLSLTSTGVANVNNVLLSNAANKPALIRLNTTGFEYIGILMKAAAATQGNALYQMTN